MNRYHYYIVNKMAFRGHPDKVCDQISDALVDAYLKQDNESRCNIQTVGTKGTIVLTGDVITKAEVDVNSVVKFVLEDVGYSTEYVIVDEIRKYSHGDVGKVITEITAKNCEVVGYAQRSWGGTYTPTAMKILQDFVQEYDKLRKIDKRFLPDGEVQLLGQYNSENNRLHEVSRVIISYQSTGKNQRETDMILERIFNNVCYKYYDDDYQWHLRGEKYTFNPAGAFSVGGFERKSGATGRQVTSDSYHSFASVCERCFSGKDPASIERAASYKAREIAINFLKNYDNAEECTVRISYGERSIEPLAIRIFDQNKQEYYLYDLLKGECIPENIIENLRLNDPNAVSFYETAKYGHFGDRKFTWEVR